MIQPEPPGLMLALIQNGPTQMVTGNIFEGLLRYSPKLEPLPGLAESWNVSEDAKVYTFKLKPGVTWHDGKPFTSADVLFSIEMLKQTHARARGNLVQLEKVEAPDDLTVVFTLKQPFGPFLGLPALAVPISTLARPRTRWIGEEVSSTARTRSSRRGQHLPAEQPALQLDLRRGDPVAWW